MTMAEGIWEYREVRFDIPPSQRALRSGERLIDRLDAVEDSKGNAGDLGRLLVTNLRVIWHSRSMSRVSLSIGLGTVLNVTSKIHTSRLRGVAEALYVLTKSSNTRFEFIFTSLGGNSERLFTSVIGVHRAFNSSKLYRELKIRGALLDDHGLKVLPQERIVTTINGVWNLSSDQGNLGTAIVTNVRFVWYSNLNTLYNISMPYMQIASVKLRDSKFGTALVLVTISSSGGYVLGFRTEPTERLDAVAQEVKTLHTAYSKSPIFGIDFITTTLDEGHDDDDDDTNTGGYEDNDVHDDHVDHDEDALDAVAAYLAEGGNLTEDKKPVYSSELGLAVEQLKEGFTISSLWQVMPK